MDDSSIACLTPTTHTTKYPQAEGCVLYKAGTIDCFDKDTAILPDFRTILPLTYRDLEIANRNGRLAIVGSLPSDFESLFLQAIEENTTLSNAEKARWRAFLI
jgi:hypothetical protein